MSDGIESIYRKDYLDLLWNNRFFLPRHFRRKHPCTIRFHKNRRRKLPDLFHHRYRKAFDPASSCIQTGDHHAFSFMHFQNFSDRILHYKIRGSLFFHMGCGHQNREGTLLLVFSKQLFQKRSLTSRTHGSNSRYHLLRKSKCHKQRLFPLKLSIFDNIYMESFLCASFCYPHFFYFRHIINIFQLFFQAHLVKYCFFPVSAEHLSSSGISFQFQKFFPVLCRKPDRIAFLSIPGHTSRYNFCLPLHLFQESFHAFFCKIRLIRHKKCIGISISCRTDPCFYRIGCSFIAVF